MLKAYIVKKGITIDAFARELGMSYSSFYRKSRGISSFTQKEICKMIELLDIPRKDILPIFFGDLT